MRAADGSVEVQGPYVMSNKSTVTYRRYLQRYPFERSVLCLADVTLRLLET